MQDGEQHVFELTTHGTLGTRTPFATLTRTRGLLLLLLLLLAMHVEGEKAAERGTRQHIGTHVAGYEHVGR
jgi:hypothetical protein